MRPADLGELDVDDLLEVLLVEGVEDDDVVEPVEELGPEVLLDGDLEPFLHLLVGRGIVVGPPVEAEAVWCTMVTSAPALVVMMMIVFLKSTLRPKLSVSRPSSMIWRSML